MDHLSTRRARGRRVAVAVLATLGLVLGGPAAVAKRDQAKKDKDDCRETSSVKLKVEPESGGVLQVTAVVWSDDSDEWDWRMKHNDDVSARGTVKAKDADKRKSKSSSAKKKRRGSDSDAGSAQMGF